MATLIGMTLCACAAHTPSFSDSIGNHCEENIIMPKKTQEIEPGLPSLSLVFGYIAIKDLENPSDQVDVLSRLGYGNIQVAQICGITPTHVGVIKLRLRNRKSRRRK